MKKFKIFFLAVSTAFVVTSCSTYKHSHRLSAVPNSTIGVTPTVVDVAADFERQVSGRSDQKTNSVQDAKDNAYYNAIVDNEIDVLVDPIYRVKVTKGLFKTTATAEVTGFAGEFVNPRTLSASETETYNNKIEALKKFVSIEEMVNEDKTTSVITNCCGGDDCGSSTQTFGSAPALIDQFNNLYSGTPVMNTTISKKGSDETGKKKGFLGFLKK
tara:strand:+ start:516 stop:1160 length:645 start_codon:yes stop_codon:yes gene_type:complete